LNDGADLPCPARALAPLNGLRRIRFIYESSARVPAETVLADARLSEKSDAVRSHAAAERPADRMLSGWRALHAAAVSGRDRGRSREACPQIEILRD